MRLPLAFALLAAASARAFGASLDVTASYDLKSVGYTNLSLGSSQSGLADHALLENNARFGFAAKSIALEGVGAQETTLDIGILFHAIGVAGSSAAIAAPFTRAAAYYPATNMTPFLENAYVRANRLWGTPISVTFGRQSYRLGSGLLLDDDGAGFTGAVVRSDLPWAGMKIEGFGFADQDPTAPGPTNLMLYGFSLGIPTDGLWQINELIEREQGDSIVYGCSADPTFAASGGCSVSKATRSFTSLRYVINYGDIFFDGEAALERGAATPDGPTPAQNHITYNGDAEVARFKWKQPLYHAGEGIAWVTLARGSGDRAGTATRDEAFYPTHGLQYDGFERVGYGDFYGATPYSALGGNYATAGSSATRSGLPFGDSGITTVGIGYTLPAYRGIVFDLGYYLYQADQVSSGPSTLGMEWDAHLRYPIRDQFSMSAGFAYFRSGAAEDPNLSVARKYTFEFKGRF
jgi:hypothetical protein